MKLADLMAGFQSTLLNWPDISVTGIADDSRQVVPGDIFFAYPGETTDGRLYIHDAVARGAVAVVYESFVPAQEMSALQSLSVPCIAYPTLSAYMGAVAARYYGYPSQQMTVIGVTGTNGKTSCTHFLASALSAAGTRCAVMGTVGNGFLPALQSTTHTTLLPLSLQKTLAVLAVEGAQAVAMEVSSHALDQGRVMGVHFTVGVFTQLSRDHLDYHLSMEAYAAAKSRLFEIPGLQYAVLNLDDAWGAQWAERYRDRVSVVTYSAEGRVLPGVPAVLADQIQLTSDGFSCHLETPWGKGFCQIGLLGQFNVSNVLAVAATLGVLGMPFEPLLTRLSALKTVAGRMEVLGGQSVLPVVVVDYAHTPDALEKALQALRAHLPASGQLWCVFGCGGDRDRGKRPQMARIAERFADRVVMTADNPRHESPEAIVADMVAGLVCVDQVCVELDRQAAIQMAVQSATVNDIVLVAGKGHETTQIIGETRFPFSDRACVLEALSLYVTRGSDQHVS